MKQTIIAAAAAYVVFLAFGGAAARADGASEMAFDGALAAKQEFNVVTYTAKLASLGGGASVEVILYSGTSANDLQISAMRTVDAAGEVSFAVPYAFVNGTVYAKMAAGTAETPVLEVNMVDSSEYVWKAGVTEGEWTDPDNWEKPDNPYLTYPNSIKCDVNLKNCTAPTVITIPETINVDWVKTDGSTLNVTFRKDPSAEGRVLLHTWGVWWNVFGGGNVTIDGIDFYCHDCGTMEVSTFRVVNGASFETNKEASFHRAGTVLEVSGKSLWKQADWSLSLTGADTTFILDDSTYQSKGTLYLGRNKDGGGDTLILRGKNPVVDCNGVISGEAFDIPPETRHTRIVFSIPKGGYAEPPFRKGNFLYGEKLKTDVLVDPKSPVFGGPKISTKLVDTDGVIFRDWITQEGQSRPERFTLRYEGGAEANRPKELWFDYVRKGFALTFR